MKCLTILAFGCIAFASAVRDRTDPGRTADKEFLLRQKKIMNLLTDVMLPPMDEEIINIATTVTMDKDVEIFRNKKVVEDFLTIRKRGLLVKDEIFSVMIKPHREEAIALFHLMHYAKTWESFHKIACWAREYINAGVFVYSLTVAVLHREDCRGMVLPPPYEIYPYYFVSSEVIQKAQVLKMQDSIFIESRAKYFGMSLKDDKFVIESNYTGTLMNIDHEQSKMSYFTEDIGLNTYYYYFHADYPFWMGGEEYGLNKDRRGELYLYVHQQLLARYYLERLSNGMKEIPTLLWHKPIKTSFVPSLMYHNRLSFPMRPKNYIADTNENVYDMQIIKDFEMRLREVIASRVVRLPTGKTLKMESPEDMTILGNLIQSNEDSHNTRFYRYAILVARHLLGVSIKVLDRHHAIPSALEHFETSLRDPVFWQLYKRLISYVIMYKNRLPAYKRDMLDFEGVKLEKVTVEKMMTHFEKVDLDITSVGVLDEEEMKMKKPRRRILARQLRMNHKPFAITMEVTSEKEDDAVVRIFLGPKHDSDGKIIRMHENRFNFVELDTFLHKLKVGKNTIDRLSTQFSTISEEQTITHDMIKRIEAGIKGEELRLDTEALRSGFPSRLLLPRGKKDGMTFQLLIVVSPWRKPTLEKDSYKDSEIWNGVGTGARYLDSMPFGYPLNRPIENEKTFITPNMGMMDVEIFHMTTMDGMKPTMGMHMEEMLETRKKNVIRD